MGNSVRLREDGIIFVVKVGDQTDRTLYELMGQIIGLASDLRRQGKSVLILTDSRHEGVMDQGAISMASKIGLQLDFDKSATFGAPGFVRLVRNQIADATQVHAKVQDFVTEEEAVAWLRSIVTFQGQKPVLGHCRGSQGLFHSWLLWW